MKIQYKFANESVEIEVSDEWGEILIDLDRQEYNNDHKETRRHYHLEGCAYEGDDFAVEDPALARLLEADGSFASIPSSSNRCANAGSSTAKSSPSYAHPSKW